MLVHTPDEIARPLFCSAAGAVRAFGRRRARAGCPLVATSTTVYTGSIAGCSANKPAVEMGEVIPALQSLFFLSGVSHSPTRTAPALLYVLQLNSIWIQLEANGPNTYPAWVESAADRLRARQHVLKQREMTYTVARDPFGTWRPACFKKQDSTSLLVLCQIPSCANSPGWVFLPAGVGCHSGTPHMHRGHRASSRASPVTAAETGLRQLGCHGNAGGIHASQGTVPPGPART